LLNYNTLFETYVAQNLLSILSARWQQATLHFWAVQGRHEVDFVIESGQNCIAIELKSSARWQEKDLSGLKAFLAATPHCRAGALCYNGKDAVKLGAIYVGDSAGSCYSGIFHVLIANLNLIVL
jgi:predicted AAA+ superfamily ATPase